MRTRPFLRNQRRTVPRTVARISTILLWIAGAVGVGARNSIFVTNTNDSGPGSLRQAIADASPSGDTVITFPGVTGRIGLTSQRLVIDRPVTIQGPGADVLAISGNGNVQVFTITNGVTNVVISGLAIIEGGSVNRIFGGRGGGGIGIFAGASVALADCVLSSNKITFNPLGRVVGGAIDNAGELEILRCIVTHNSAGDGRDHSTSSSGGGDGGGIFNSGRIAILSSRINGNLSGRGGNGGGGYCGSYAHPGNGGSGGGLYNVGSATIVSSFFEGNRAGKGGDACGSDAFLAGVGGGAGGSGGGIFSSGELIVSNCVIVANWAGVGGDGGFGGISYDIAPSLRGGDGGNAGEGGGIFSLGRTHLLNTTVIGNRALAGGQGGLGGLHALPPGPRGPTGSVGAPGIGGGVSGMVVVTNCIVVANSSLGDGPDAFGQFTSEGENVLQISDGSIGFGLGDFLGVDPDGDGLPNLVEYAFGTDPRTPTVGAWPGGSIQRVGGTNYFGFSFQRTTNAVGVLCSVMTSDSMGTNGWVLGSRYFGGTEVHERTVEISRQVNGPVETILLRDRLPASSSTSRFMRLDVSVP